MLRKILMTTVAASAMVGSAYAADLPRRAPPPAYVPPVPIFTWTGFYIGANVGGAFRANNRGPLEDAVFFGGAAPVGALIVANNNNNSGRFLIGGQAGYNWQINNFVLGIEGDGDVAVGRTDNFPGFLNPRTNTGFFATVRGRGGIAFDRFLVYGTGGVAFGNRRDFGNTFIGTTFGGLDLFTTNNASNTAVGYTVGGGVEYAFLNNWSVKAEYLFVDLGTNRRTFFSPVTGAGVIIDARREQFHTVRVGLNYRFNWGGYGAAAPVVARY